MFASPFNARRKTLTAAAASGVAMLLVGFYVAAPAPEATLAAQAKSSSTPKLDGRIKTSKKHKRTLRVWVSIRRNGKVLKRAMVLVRADGTFVKPLPAGADFVRVVIRDGDRITRGGFEVAPGRALTVTANFPRGGGIVPSLFPY